MFIIILISIVYLVLLELSQNTLLGWTIAILLTFGYFLIRRRSIRLAAAQKRRRSRGKGFLMFAAWLILLWANYMLTQPPIRQVPVSAESHPQVTDVVSIAQGELTGVYNEDHTARTYAGIPYAAPPVGGLRWKEPQPAESWEGVRACDTFAPMAMQEQGSPLMSSLYRLLGYHDYRISLKDNYREAMSEDCLYLNVYAPADTGTEPLPVLFFIHGGSLMTGQSYYSEYRGETLAAQGIIVVNFAYRLGAFGYFANENLAAESPNRTTGNYGLLDQIAALMWVHDNIAAFGGDPNNITIAGESAGSSSVNALCVSPLTEGIFKRAIAESSGITPMHPYHTFRQMTDALQMGHDMMDEFKAESLEDMRAVPADQLVNTRYANSAMTIDGYAITEMPYLTYEKGQNHEEALISGFNAKEADAFMLGTKATAENYEELLRPVFGEYAAEAAALVPADAITRDQHFIIDAGGDAKGSLNHLYSAAWFTYSHECWNRLMTAQDKPVYGYYFTKTNNSLSNYHAGEMPYAYGNLWRHLGLYDASDEALSEIMQSYWLNFVKTGDPNGEGLPEWEMWNPDDQNLLELDEEVQMISDPYKDIYTILDKYQKSLQ